MMEILETGTSETFVEESLRKIFTEKKDIIDIGAGLRLRGGNRTDPRKRWLNGLIEANSVRMRVLDKVPDYHPDIVADIQALPFPDTSIDAIICLAILAHVEEPQKALDEVRRVLKPGGYCFLYMPFLTYYLAEEGYYKDFHRFTADGIEHLTRRFSSVKISPSRGPLGTLLGLIPTLAKKRPRIIDWLDRRWYPKSRQVRGYHVFCVK